MRLVNNTQQDVWLPDQSQHLFYGESVVITSPAQIYIWSGCSGVYTGDLEKLNLLNLVYIWKKDQIEIYERLAATAICPLVNGQKTNSYPLGWVLLRNFSKQTMYLGSCEYILPGTQLAVQHSDYKLWEFRVCEFLVNPQGTIIDIINKE